MSDKDWDAEDFEPNIPVSYAGDKLEGEDEDEFVKDDWDASEEEGDDEKENAEEKKKEAEPPVTVKKKSKLKDRLAEIEKKDEEKRQRKEVEHELTPKEKLAVKIEGQRRQEESDLNLAKEAFGVNNTSDAPSIESMNPRTPEQFKELHEAIAAKLKQFKDSPLFITCLEDLLRNLSECLDSDDTKKLSGTLNAIYNEKIKAEKSIKGGKKKGKSKGLAKVYEGRDIENYAEYEDFI